GRWRGIDIFAVSRLDDGAAEFGDAVVAIRDLGRDRAIERGLESGGPATIGTHLGEGARSGRQSPNERLLRGELRIGQLTREHVEEQQSERVNVGAMIELVARELLG